MGSGEGGGAGGEWRSGWGSFPFPALSGVSRAGCVFFVVPAPESTLSSSVPPALGKQQFLAASNLGCFADPIRVSVTPSLHYNSRLITWPGLHFPVGTLAAAATRVDILQTAAPAHPWSLGMLP